MGVRLKIFIEKLDQQIKSYTVFFHETPGSPGTIKNTISKTSGLISQ